MTSVDTNLPCFSQILPQSGFNCASACRRTFIWRLCMKLAVVVLALAMTGCATVNDIEHTPPTMNVMSGKNPKEYADCFVGKIASSRKPPLIEPRHDGLRVIVAQKLSKSPAAVVDVESRSGGSTIKVYERLANVPIRFRDVQNAAEACISG
ncbi:putative lipoprotein [Pseudomonas viridiflava]|uniref:Putative lipoprotein n=1 Tax=Pseudomonas viridiflava TaxID=33069 RepID=A0A3M4PKV8_PSEVI|nr:putative lipoprotein [Pseudomonas viridiflava]